MMNLSESAVCVFVIFVFAWGIAIGLSNIVKAL